MMEESEAIAKSGTDPLKLELSPLHSPLRVGQWYSLTATLKRGGIPTSHSGHLKIEAFQEDNKEPRELILRDGADGLKLEADGNCALAFKLTEPTKVVDSKPKKTVVRVSLLDSNTANTKALAVVETHPLVVFKFGLKVVENHAAPYIFYKDKGGKDQGIELEVRLVDEGDNLVAEKDIMLMPVLLYEGGAKVADQSILTMSNDKSALRLSHGKTNVKFRINQVSTKHCNQKFCILMTQACRENEFPEVAPAISIPVDVRSKKNKRPSQGGSGFLPGLSSVSNDTDFNPNKRMRLASESRSNIVFDPEVNPTSILAPLLANGETFAASIKLIEDFIKEIMIKMKDEIRWRQSGINRDSGEPLYEIRNPNPVIDRLLGSFDRISAALNNMNRLRHVLDACVSHPSIAAGASGKFPSVKMEPPSSSQELSVSNLHNTHSGIITSLSSSLDIASHSMPPPKFLKPDALVMSMRTDSGDTMESHGASVLTEKSDDMEVDKSTIDPAAITPAKGEAGKDGGGYDMLDMLATVAKNSKDLLKGNKGGDQGKESTTPGASGLASASQDTLSNKSTHFAFENPLPGQFANDNLNVTLIITEYVTVDNMIQGFPGLRFDANGNLELLGFYRIIVDKNNLSSFDETRIKEIGATNSILMTNNFLRQTFAKEDGNDGQLMAVLDVIVKKDQPHDVRIEMWRYYHDAKPFQQPKVLNDKKLTLKFQQWNSSIFSDAKKQKIEKFSSGKINSNVALVKQKANNADILAKTAQRLVTCNVFGLIV